MAQFGQKIAAWDLKGMKTDRNNRNYDNVAIEV